jgi:hypothetical protein
MKPEIVAAIERLRVVKRNTMWSDTADDLELIIAELERLEETWWHRLKKRLFERNSHV